MNGSNFSLNGKTALVTGSSKGLGRAMAYALGAAGAKVAFNYCHDRVKAEEAFEVFTQQGGDGVSLMILGVP